MPLFDFLCGTCGVFELIVDLQHAKENIRCPKCGSRVDRLFSTPAFYRPFAGDRHHLQRKADQGREPIVVKKGVGDPLEAKLPVSHPKHHHQGCGSHDTGHPPWMLKH